MKQFPSGANFPAHLERTQVHSWFRCGLPQKARSLPEDVETKGAQICIISGEKAPSIVWKELHIVSTQACAEGSGEAPLLIGNCRDLWVNRAAFSPLWALRCSFLLKPSAESWRRSVPPLGLCHSTIEFLTSHWGYRSPPPRYEPPIGLNV